MLKCGERFKDRPCLGGDDENSPSRTLVSDVCSSGGVDLVDRAIFREAMR